MMTNNQLAFNLEEIARVYMITAEDVGLLNEAARRLRSSGGVSMKAVSAGGDTTAISR